ncbi:MAG: hypothetical protein ACI395_07540, partial [Candidatus Cryptobacteroides sp.]
YLFLLSALGLAVSCTQDSKTAQTGSCKAELSFGKYYTPEGVVKTPEWKSGELAGAFDLSTGLAASAKAIGVNTNTATFVYTMEGISEGSELAFFHPAGAASFEGGRLAMEISTEQDGSGTVPPQIGCGKVPGSTYTSARVDLVPLPCLVLATVQKGDYSITKAEMRSKSNEGIAGKVLADPRTKTATADALTITVTLDEPLDCRMSNRTVPFFIAPVALSSGFEITFTRQDGETFTSEFGEAREFKAGEKFETEPAASQSRKLIACGDHRVIMLDAELAAKSNNYNDAVVWEWTSTKFAFGKSNDHIDDCKVVNDGKQFLVTCSNNNAWCAVVEYPSGEVSYVVEDASNAHSAELLPGNKLVVASSDGGDKVLLYNIGGSTKPVASYQLSSAHGVVWNSATQRLYAVGTSDIQIYSLSGETTSSPSLKLEKTLSSTGFITYLHDATLVNSDKIIMAGNGAAILDIKTETLTAVKHLNGVVGVKSVNYNADSGELYYTHATTGTSEGDFTWSSHKIRYTDDINKAISGDGTGTSSWSYINIPDMNMYKVRVFSW